MVLRDSKGPVESYNAYIARLATLIVFDEPIPAGVSDEDFELAWRLAKVMGCLGCGA